MTLAWLDYPAGSGARVFTSVSTDGGSTWSKPESMLGTSGESDHPQLATKGHETYLAWFTEAEGLRVVRAGG